jgi:hypothetical protein
MRLFMSLWRMLLRALRSTSVRCVSQLRRGSISRDSECVIDLSACLIPLLYLSRYAKESSSRGKDKRTPWYLRGR